MCYTQLLHITLWLLKEKPKVKKQGMILVVYKSLVFLLHHHQSAALVICSLHVMCTFVRGHHVFPWVSDEEARLGGQCNCGGGRFGELKVLHSVIRSGVVILSINKAARKKTMYLDLMPFMLCWRFCKRGLDAPFIHLSAGAVGD